MPAALRLVEAWAGAELGLRLSLGRAFEGREACTSGALRQAI
ncbi:MAG: hypothetical protein AVDCRST_MAG45-897 [uncultured Solirubrobacterales bacterium]|uniref:Uncharacterized protein n=1 Tax=uncultured Solirubrobacterales bacterium TaxID=768556 RepID=A0A6J4SJF1_9ACTN|nr:MAG: hypothetical protein AVDCRST_MAG45-897 [uncultured Solirubrobacterales bacterium]